MSTSAFCGRNLQKSRARPTSQVGRNPNFADSPGRVCLRAPWSPSVSGVSIVNIARCAEHGLHGERSECFICGGPVEQVSMMTADYFSRAEIEWLESAARNAASDRIAAFAKSTDDLMELAGKLRTLRCAA
jgi:hypothetical protein